MLRDLDPAPRYVVLGETHPNIVRHSGEAYRESLQALAVERGVDHLIEFDGRYRGTAEILAEIRKADIVLLAVPLARPGRLGRARRGDRLGEARRRDGLPACGRAARRGLRDRRPARGLRARSPLRSGRSSPIRPRPRSLRRSRAVQAATLTWENVGLRYRSSRAGSPRRQL